MKTPLIPALALALTVGDICNALGINSDGKNAGVVVNASTYNGYFSNNLWEKLQLWEGA